MLGKAIWRLKIQENPSAAGAPPGPRWGSLQRSHKPPIWWEGAGSPSPRTPSPALSPSGLASPTSHSKISSDAVDDIRPHVQRRRSVVKSGGRGQSGQTIKLFQSASKLVLPSIFDTSVIPHVMGPAELPNYGSEWKNVTFWGSRHALIHPIYFQGVRTLQIHDLRPCACVTIYQIRNHSIYETHRRFKIPTRAPWVRSFSTRGGKMCDFRPKSLYISKTVRYIHG